MEALKNILNDTVPALDNIPNTVYEAVDAGLAATYLPDYLPKMYGQPGMVVMVGGIYYLYKGFLMPAITQQFPK